MSLSLAGIFVNEKGEIWSRIYKMEQDLQEQDLQDEQDMSRIFKICKIFRMSFRPNRSAGACSPQED